MYRDRLERYSYARHLYKQDENGERVYLDDDEMSSVRGDTQKRIDEFCNS